MKKLEISQMENFQGSTISCKTAAYFLNVGIFSAAIGAELLGGSLIGIYGAYYLEHCM